MAAGTPWSSRMNSAFSSADSTGTRLYAWKMTPRPSSRLHWEAALELYCTTRNPLGPGMARTQEFISSSFCSRSRRVVLLST